MTRENVDRIVLPKTIKHPAHGSLGHWSGDRFDFASPAHEQEWRGQAYRQSVHPDRWQAQAPVDAQTQSLLEEMPHLGAGQFFRGPDGKHRRITTEQREDKAVQALRRTAFNEYAKTGVTWADLGQHPDDDPHPGEAEAVALMQAKAAPQPPESKAVLHQTVPDKTRSTEALPATRENVTRIAGDLQLGLSQLKDPWGAESVEAEQSPVLIASSDKAGTVPGWLKGYTEPVPAAPARPLPGSLQRRAYNEKLIGYPANDNSRRAANENPGAASTEGNTAGIGRIEIDGAAKVRVGTRGEAEADPDIAVTDRLFNWSRKGLPRPAPSEFALHAASDEGRFTYLEEMKDEWSQQLAANPEKVFRSMQGEVEKIANAAQKDFVTSHHQQPTAAETAEIIDAVTDIVFAPAEHWTERAGDKPNEKVDEVKPFLGIVKPEKLSGGLAVQALGIASTIVAQLDIEKEGGRLGSKETRDMAELLTQKLATAIEACGGEIVDTYNGKREPLIRRIKNLIKGGHYPDSGVTFKYNGKTVGAFANHAGTWANGYTLLANESKQIYGLARNLARAVAQGDLEISVAGLGYFSKRKPDQSMDDYLKKMDEFVSDMIDCGRPFLVKASFAKFEEEPVGIANDNVKILPSGVVLDDQ